MKNVLVKLTVAGNEIEGGVAVPEGDVAVREILPVLRGLTDAVVALAIRSENEAGRDVSCRAGCGACCRQMVPISPAEAFGIRQTLASLPPSRRKKIERKIATAINRLQAADLLDKLRQRAALSEPELKDLDRAYFAAQIPCPFLENESCGIYAERPLACREYLVTSPAAHCSRPTADRVAQVPMPAKVSMGLSRAESGAWVPLVLALEFAAASTESPQGDAAEIIQRILTSI